jgi:hypothetical protein
MSSKIDISTYEKFLENKQILLDAFEDAIHETLKTMGDQKLCCGFLCGRAEYYQAIDIAK